MKKKLGIRLKLAVLLGATALVPLLIALFVFVTGASRLRLENFQRAFLAVAASESARSSWYQSPGMCRASSHVAARVVFPAPGGPAIQMTGWRRRPSRIWNSRRRG